MLILDWPDPVKQSPMKKSVRIPVRDKLVSKTSFRSSCLWIFVSDSSIMTLSLDLPCLLDSGVFVYYLPVMIFYFILTCSFHELPGIGLFFEMLLYSDSVISLYLQL